MTTLATSNSNLVDLNNVCPFKQYLNINNTCLDI